MAASPFALAGTPLSGTSSPKPTSGGLPGRRALYVVGWLAALIAVWWLLTTGDGQGNGGDYVAKVPIVGPVAQVAQRLEYWQAGTVRLLEVEAEGDQLATVYVGPAVRWRCLLRGRQVTSWRPICSSRLSSSASDAAASSPRSRRPVPSTAR